MRFCMLCYRAPFVEGCRTMANPPKVMPKKKKIGGCLGPSGLPGGGVDIVPLSRGQGPGPRLNMRPLEWFLLRFSCYSGPGSTQPRGPPESQFIEQRRGERRMDSLRRGYNRPNRPETRWAPHLNRRRVMAVTLCHAEASTRACGHEAWRAGRSSCVRQALQGKHHHRLSASHRGEGMVGIRGRFCAARAQRGHSAQR